jgi:hypothetical protein
VRPEQVTRQRRTPVAAAAGGAAAVPPAPQKSKLEQIADVATMLFPVWALISGCTAFFRPASLNWMTTQQFEWGVGLLMLAMGLSLTKEDFRKCAANPVPILLGFVCQYSVLPLLAVAISKLMHLPAAFATGLILLGCCPGGQASNVATFVAHGDVALSVLMTAGKQACCDPCPAGMHAVGLGMAAAGLPTSCCDTQPNLHSMPKRTAGLLPAHQGHPPSHLSLLQPPPWLPL